MKRESRVLVTHCEGSVCAGVVIRAGSVDGVLLSAEGCEGLARRAAETGYMDELRASLGPCGAGLAEVPKEHQHRHAWAVPLARDLCIQFKSLFERASELQI